MCVWVYFRNGKSVAEYVSVCHYLVISSIIGSVRWKRVVFLALRFSDMRLVFFRIFNICPWKLNLGIFFPKKYLCMAFLEERALRKFFFAQVVLSSVIIVVEEGLRGEFLICCDFNLVHKATQNVVLFAELLIYLTQVSSLEKSFFF